MLEPCSTGLGGDMFCLHYDSRTRTVESVNGSGRCPAALTLDAVRARHPTAADMARRFPTSVDSVTVPGAARGWEDTVVRFGSGNLTMAQILEPARVLAEEGFPVATLTASRWSAQMDDIVKWHGADEVENGEVELAADGGREGPRPGQLFRNPSMANVLRSLGEHGAARGFYGGFPGRSIVEAVRRHGGSMTMDDLTKHESTFEDAISVEYRGKRIWECPPNGQGIAGLIALEGLKSLEESGDVEPAMVQGVDVHPQMSAATLHAAIEAMRLGFADARRYVCDPASVEGGDESESSPGWLLDKDRIAERARELFDRDKAVVQGTPTPSSCTVSFQVVDERGNAMSFVNSNYMGFGTGLTPKGCGFTLQNRGSGFSLDATHPNALAPNKRPYHTIIPCMVTHSDTGELYSTLTNMGGFMQPQGHLQLAVNLLALGMDPQTAIDAPRFCILDGTRNGTVFVETGFLPETVEALGRMGHRMKSGVAGNEREVFGRAQVITRDRETGVLCAGSDGRADGCALGY